MKAVVFTEEPGMGKAYVTSFESEEEADGFADSHDAIVFTNDDLEREVARLRRWMKSAYEEFCTARRRCEHAQKMLDEMYEYEEQVAPKRVIKVPLHIKELWGIS